jgi:Pectate lyase superfamily protein
LGRCLHRVRNGGTIIAPASNPSSGRWKRLIEGPVSVRWFGARGKGRDDDTDTEAVQAAEDFAAETGGIVYFPPGTYTINGAKATIAEDTQPGSARKYGIEKKSNTKWVGCGYGSSILRLKNNSTADVTSPPTTVDPQIAPKSVAAVWFNGEQLQLQGIVVEYCKFIMVLERRLSLSRTPRRRGPVIRLTCSHPEQSL